MLGYNKAPKLILKIDLIEEIKLKVTLVLLNNHYLNNSTNETYFSKNNGFMIYKSRSFTMFKYKTMGLPNDFPKTNIQSTTIYFNSDIERYNFLKILKNDLINWSKSKVWDGYNDNSDVKLTFVSKTWVLF